MNSQEKQQQGQQQQKEQQQQGQQQSNFQWPPNPPPAKSLPLPPLEWMQNSSAHDFCPSCENVYYVKNEQGDLIQMMYECNCEE